MATPPYVPAFKYQPLDLDAASLRVFTIAPGRPGSVIDCRLRHIDSLKGYTCLSYAWGDERDPETILLNGARFSVRRNLYNFLCQARQNGFKAPLWVDAICIDQTNTAERNHQVQQMVDVYSNAKQVLVWIGQVSSRLAAFVTMMRLLTRCPPETIATLLMNNILYLFPQWREATVDATAATYWGRLWVVQELMLNEYTHIVADKHLVNIYWFLEAIHYLPVCERGIKMRDEANQRAQDNTRSSHLNVLMEVRADYIRRRRLRLCGANLNELVAKFRILQCTENKDHIYGLLGLCRERSIIKVRYDESDPETLLRVLLQVYEQFDGFGFFLHTAMWMCRSLNLACGIWCGQCVQEVPGLPEELHKQEIQDICATHTAIQLSGLALLVVSSQVSQPDHDRYYNITGARGRESLMSPFPCSHCLAGIRHRVGWSLIAVHKRTLWLQCQPGELPLFED